MPNTFESTQPPSSLGKWLEELYYHRIICQPEDDVLIKAFEECVSEDFVARINQDQYSRQDYMKALLDFRVDTTTRIESTQEIRCWNAPDKSGSGCVSQLVHVVDVNKKTGASTKSSTLLIANIKVVNGRRVWTELTEILNGPE
ncbi:hypothetical protein FSPOR_9069 [Fusarium sporotrichioides]|uniref:SnoaL-like domain-containing protein n=1 Tax=Fusarium sporotrichioides TaxID=5514 RepID=A0A395RRJ4_FUSSP|nr:hypothetical protein FSPOR_9069 [Fusarium sporotrichioides]